MIAQLDHDFNADAALRRNWTIVFDWRETDRYDFKDDRAARELLDAINDSSHGVLQWINQQF